MALPEILTVGDVAALLGCETPTVQQKALAGELPGLKHGRPWVFPREALLSTLNAQALEQAAERAAERAKSSAPKAVQVKPGRRRTTPVSLP